MTESKRINCLKCRHYYVTWDPNFPKGCRAFGFKSVAMPSLEVLASSGKPCMGFEPKPPRTSGAASPSRSRFI